MPPTTPPAIAPVGVVDLGEAVAVAVAVWVAVLVELVAVEVATRACQHRFLSRQMMYPLPFGKCVMLNSASNSDESQEAGNVELFHCQRSA